MPLPSTLPATRVRRVRRGHRRGGGAGRPLELRVLQLNAGRGAEVTSALLEIAREQHCDVVLVQEPGGFFDAAARRSLPRILGQHYQIYLPSIEPGARPRVATYVRRHGLSWTTISRSDLTVGNPDVLVTDFEARSGQKLRVANVYNAPPGCAGAGVGAECLMSLPEHPEPMLAAGDFNLYHSDWATDWWSGSPTAQGEALAAWATERCWAFGLERGSVTRPSAGGGSAIDLVLANERLEDSSWLRSCEVRADLGAGSDHWPILSLLRCGVGQAQERELRFRFDRADWDKYRRSLRDLHGHYLGGPLARLRAGGDEGARRGHLDALAAATQRWVFEALRESVPRTATTGQGHCWWTAECTRATKQTGALEQELSETTGAGILDVELLEAVRRSRQDTQRVLKRTREHYYRTRANNLEGNDIFAARKWARAERQYASPALHDGDGGVVVSIEEKRSLLRTTLVPDRPREDVMEVMAGLPSRGCSALDHQPLTREELRSAVWAAAPDKAPGEDEITSRAIREGWEHIGDPLFELASAAFDTGWYPRPFRHAIFSVMRKPGRRDPTLPRSYRLIALLPTLGKAIEKVAADRLAFYASQLGLIPADQFGAVQHKSTADAGLSLVHDVHTGWATKCGSTRLTTSVLTYDVVGAFDNSDPACYIRLLWSAGLPGPFVAFMASWMHERSARIKLDGSIGTTFRVSCGFPQGSSLSPVSFAIYLSPMWDRLPPSVPAVRLMAYVDDAALVVQGVSVEGNCSVLEQVYTEMATWADEVGLRFDPDKRELIHFPPRARSNNRRQALLPVRLGPQPNDTITAVDWTGSVRWLGLYLNPALDWKHHVRITCAKARGAVQCLRMLANTVRGPSALLLRRAFVSCILPILTYACAVWWRGLRRRVARSCTVAVPGAVKIAQLLNGVQNQALRIILPVWRTTPVVALQCESSLPPVELLLGYLLQRYAIRLRTLPEDHPLISRVPTQRSLRYGRIQSPLLDLARSSSGVERGHVSAPPPWCAPLSDQPRFSLHLQDGRTKEQAAADHQERTLGDRSTVYAYTDGSATGEGGARRVGAGFAVYHTATTGDAVTTLSIRMRPETEVFDAEAYALLRGLERALELADASRATQVCVFVDNVSVLQTVTSARPSSSARVFIEIRQKISTWLSVDPTRTISISWIPGHTGVAGNDAADAAARRGASLRPDELATRGFPTSVAAARRTAKDALVRRWARAFAECSAHSQYRALRRLPPSLVPGPHLAEMKRRILGLWLQAKCGHGDFAAYHTRPHFNHPTAALYCRCGQRKERLHPLDCPSYQAHQPILSLAPAPAHPSHHLHSSLFNQRSGIALFAEYVTLSRAYDCNKAA